MTPPASDDQPRVRTTPSRQAYRSELTRQVLHANREDEIATHLPSDQATLVASARAGAQWFYWVAALSLVNSVIALSGGHITFLAGLAVSQIADGVAAHLGLAGPYFSVGIDLVIAFFFCGFGYLTTHGSRAAFLAGMILYTLDGMIFLLFSAYLPVLFHGFALFQMIMGWKARQKLARLRGEPPTLGPSV